MYLIYRHLLKSAVGPFFFGWFVITFLLMIDVLFRYVDLFVSKGVPFLLATKVLVLSLGYTFALSIPMAVLIAILMSVGQLAADHEITALKACGISLWAVMRPLVLGAALIGAGLAAYNHYVFPQSNHTLANLLFDINHKKPMLEIREHQFTEMTDRVTIYVAKKDDLTGKIEDVQILEKEQPGDLSPQVTIATHGRIVPDHDSNSILIELFDGEIHKVPDKDNPERYQVIRFSQHNMHMANMEVDFQESGRQSRGDREMDLNDLQDAAAKERVNQARVGKRVLEGAETFLTWYFKALHPAQRQLIVGSTFAPPPGPQLDAYLERKHKATRTRVQRMIETTGHQTRLLESYIAHENRYLVEFHKKFAIPFACLVFALLGVPMAVSTSRSGKGVSVSLALAIYLIYYLFLMGGEKVADRGKLDPFIAMWAANILLLGIGIPMFFRAVSETTFWNIGALWPFGKNTAAVSIASPPKPPETP
ncbi:MAG: lipopolysaccharide export system permease protein [Candidatus Krumholzibacteriia bacterium]|jgi:lipopolysaccharide export system permease protein